MVFELDTAQLPLDATPAIAPRHHVLQPTIIIIAHFDDAVETVNTKHMYSICTMLDQRRSE